MNIFPFRIFPTGILSNSVFISVCIGAILTILMNMSLGWAISGIVIPGYLAPLILLKPMIALSILFEGIITYLIHLAFKILAERSYKFHSFFGRDRFFFILLISILVRVIFDKGIFPYIGEFINHTYHVNFDYKNNLHTFGIIIISLIANSLYSSGFRRGIIPIIITSVTVALILRYVLGTLTNFSIHNLGHIYSEIAVYLDTAPKAYIILLITAYFGSLLNLQYGFSFNGILIPALLALQWFNPIRILISILEAGIIYLIVKGIERLRIINQSYFEGSRKLLIFFIAVFIYKIVVTYILNRYPHVRSFDFMGFGYLLTTLIAIRIFDGGRYFQIASSLIQLLVIALISSMIIGYALTFIPSTVSNPDKNITQLTKEPINYITLPLDQFIKTQRIQYYYNEFYLAKTSSEHSRSILLKSLKHLQNIDYNKNQTKLKNINIELRKIHYQISIINPKYIYVSPSKKSENMGTYLINTQSHSKLIILLSRINGQTALISATLKIYTKLNAKMMIIPPLMKGDKTKLHVYFSSRVLLNSLGNTFKNMKFIQVIAPPRNALCWKNPSNPMIYNDAQSVFVVKNKSLYNSINKILVTELPNLKITNVYGSLPTTVYNKSLPSLYLSSCQMNTLANSTSVENKKNILSVIQNVLAGYLTQWSKTQPITPGSQKYTPPSMAQLMYLNREVLQPLTQVLRIYYKTKFSKEKLHVLYYLSKNASLLGYQIVIFHDTSKDKNYIILKHNDKSLNYHYWGTYIFSVSLPGKYFIEIPRAFFESSTLEFGIDLFQNLNALVLMLPGTHPYASISGKTDVLLGHNLATVYNLVNQVLLSENEGNYLPVLVRGFSHIPNQPVPKSDVIVAFRLNRSNEKQLGPLEKNLISALRKLELSVELSSGSRTTSGYHVGIPAQVKYLRLSKKNQIATVWISPVVRYRLRQDRYHIRQTRQFNILNIETREVNMINYILDKVKNKQMVCGYKLDKSLAELVYQYTQHRSILDLQSLMKNLKGYNLFRLVDKNIQKSFLIIEKDKKLVAVFYLSLDAKNRTYEISCTKSNEKDIDNFIKSKRLWMYFK